MSANNIERCYNIIREMLNQREYKNIEEDDEKFTAITNDDSKMCVFKDIIAKISVDEIKNKVNIMDSLKIKHCIIIYSDSVTSHVKKALIELENINYNIEIFCINNLLFNITKHELVPIHIVLDKEDSQKIKKEIGTNIPIIQKAVDPIAKFYDYRRGDIIKIIRCKKNEDKLLLMRYQEMARNNSDLDIDLNDIEYFVSYRIVR